MRQRNWASARWSIPASRTGIGRVAAIDSVSATVRFFKGPSRHPYADKSIELAIVTAASLAPHTRVYVSDGVRWKIGRIDSEHPDRDGRYAVSFPRQEGMILSADDFEVRWLPPVEDPFESLAVLCGDNPVIYRSRIDLITEWHRQASATRGVEDLFLASAELHDHQLTVVRTVAADSLRRYLLADEVGLGKTIEAGALVARCVRGNSRQRVLVLAPEHLRQQWASELGTKFHLDQALGDAVVIASHSEWQAWPSSTPHMLVVDEAHHLTRLARGSEAKLSRLRELAHGAESVLLLSATPVRSNEVAFLDLLNLLDPENYRRDDVASFTERVRIRDQMALIYQALADDLDRLDATLYAEELTRMFPNDPALGLLARRAADCADSERPATVKRMREHLSRTYRLHHRLLRTRRSPQIGAHFEVRGRWRAEPFAIEVADETDGMRRDMADGFRAHLTEQVETGAVEEGQATAAFARLAEACGSLPTALLWLADPPDAGPQRESRSLVCDWLAAQGDYWRRELSAYEPLVMSRIAEELERMAISKDRGKVVVVSGFTAVAVAVANALVQRRGGHRVATHLGHESRAEQTAAIARWKAQPECRVLVCDASADEGINLQTASVIVHLDLSWEAFRVEQRIGRADRFITDNDLPVESAVVTYGEQPLARNWIAYLRDVCRVFDESVSSLQYVLADAEAAMLRRVLSGGADALTSDLPQRREALVEEARRITAHDALDAVESQHGGLNDRVLEADADPSMGSAMTTWLKGVGARLTAPHEGTIRVARKPRPQVPFELERAMAPWIEEELALTRTAAVRHRRPIVRAGHSLLDAIAEHLLGTDRGIAFAFWRPAKGIWPPVPLLRTDFLVRVGENPQLRDAAAQEGLADWLVSTIEAAMPPIAESVVVQRYGAEVTHADGIRRFSDRRGDRNLMSDPEQFAALTAHLDWGTLCGQGLESATDVLARRPSVSEAPTTAASAVSGAIEDRLAALGARADTSLRGGAGQRAGLERLAGAVPERLTVVREVLGCGVILCGDSDRKETAVA